MAFLLLFSVFFFTIGCSLINSKKEDIKDEKINIVVTNNNTFSYYLYSFDNPCKNLYFEFTKDFKGWTININFCQYYSKIKKYLMINDDNKAYFYENKNDLI